MTASSLFTSLLWFAAVVAAIPAALWLLKRTPAGGGATHGLMRTVAVLPLAPGQRVVTVEVGRGELRHRRVQRQACVPCELGPRQHRHDVA